MEVQRIEDLYPVVKRLLGAIEPIGETNVDEIRLENLKDTMYLVEKLMYDIHEVSKQSNRMEHSIGLAGRTANEFIKNIAFEYTR